jgi:hypothetical protein
VLQLKRFGNPKKTSTMAKQSDFLAKVPKKSSTANQARGQVWQGAPLPLRIRQPTKADLEARTYSKYTVPVDHSNTSSGDISSIIYHIDGTEDLRTTIQWKLDIDHMVSAKRVTNLEVILELTRARCQGAPRQTYLTLMQRAKAVRAAAAAELAKEIPKAAEEKETEAAFEKRVTEYKKLIEKAKQLTMDDHEKALQAVIKERAPRNVLSEQENAMRHEFHKPFEMPFKVYVNNLTYINTVEMPELPPFGGVSQSLPEKAMKEIIVHGVPLQWKTQMDSMGIQPSEKSLEEINFFMESQETANKRAGTHNNGRGTKKQKRSGDTHDRTATGMWCDHHGVNTHNTADCHAKPFHKQDGKSKYNNNNHRGNRSNGNGNKNKTWKQRADQNKAVTLNEVNVLLEKGFKKLTTELAKSNKRKSRSEDANMVEILESEAEDTDSEVDELVRAVNNELHVAETMQVDGSDSEDTTGRNADLVRKWLNRPTKKNDNPLKADYLAVKKYPVKGRSAKVLARDLDGPKTRKVKKTKKVTKSDGGVTTPKIKERVAHARVPGPKIRKIKKNKKIEKVTEGVTVAPNKDSGTDNDPEDSTRENVTETKKVENTKINVADNTDNKSDDRPDKNDKKIENMTEAELSVSDKDVDDLDTQLAELGFNFDKTGN